MKNVKPSFMKSAVTNFAFLTAVTLPVNMVMPPRSVFSARRDHPLSVSTGHDQSPLRSTSHLER